jgi:hypothetical protein
MPESSTEKRTGKLGLKISMIRKMLPLLKLKLDHHISPLSKLKLLLTRAKNSRTPHPLLLCQNTLKELNQDKPLLTEETVPPIWVLFTERKAGKHGLKI